MYLTTVKLDAARAVAAALAVLREGGIETVSMRAVAEQARVTPPAIYWYFRDKDALVAALVREARRSFRRRLERSMDADTPIDRLLAALTAFRELAIEDPHVFDLLFVRGGGPLRRRVRSAQSESIFEFLIDRVTDCLASQDLRTDDPVEVALTLAAMCQGLVLLQRRGRFTSETTFRRFFDSAIQRLLHGLRA